MIRYIIRTVIVLSLFICLSFLSCKKDNSNPYVKPDGDRYSEIFTGGQYHLGPVDWQESKYTNAFGPYPQQIQQIEGIYLAGLELSHNRNGEICDACVKISTDQGKSLIVRIITTGITTKNSIDLSPEAYNVLNSGEYPRSMSWYVTKCPSNGHNIIYQFKSASNKWWTSFWARNVALPLYKVETKNQNHSDWYQLKRESDGSYVDDKGFGTNVFNIRLTAIDGRTIEDTYQSFSPGGILESSSQF
jgi:expansin (peptidoglycan-binding protein)